MEQMELDLGIESIIENAPKVRVFSLDMVGGDTVLSEVVQIDVMTMNCLEIFASWFKQGE